LAYPKLNLPKPFNNFYGATLLIALFWMLFIDSNDFISQFKTWRKLQVAKREKVYYQAKINEVREKKEEIMGNTKKLEKYARERYFMKKPDEDLYIIK
jgi:cell division protein FtsB